MGEQKYLFQGNGQAMIHSKLISYTLLFLVIVVWAVAWPVSKIGLNDMPPIWYSAMRLFIGFAIIFIILLAQNKIKIPKRKDFPLILSIGLLQMASFLVLLNGGLIFVDAGRSAILVYATPFLVTPIAVFIFKERLTVLKLLGLVFGLIGLLLLFAPWTFDWSSQSAIIGNSMLLLAALCWAIAMLHTRYGKWHSSHLDLIPWQLLIAVIFVTIVALIIEPHPSINWTNQLLATGFYNGILATGFAYTAIIYVSQRLPVINTSVLLLGVPVLGLLLSSWWLGEKITLNIIIAISLIISGLMAIAIDQPRGNKT